jgi:hypothetical protein
MKLYITKQLDFGTQIYTQNICAMQNYIMLTQKIPTFLCTYYFKS